MSKFHYINSHDFKTGMTSDEILAQAVAFFLVGYETTATTISFLAYNLALHQDVQDKLIEEVDRVIGNKVSNDKYLSLCNHISTCGR